LRGWRIERVFLCWYFEVGLLSCEERRRRRMALCRETMEYSSLRLIESTERTEDEDANSFSCNSSVVMRQ